MSEPHWEIDACRCGFGDGDVIYDFDTEQEANDFADYLRRDTDATVHGVRRVETLTDCNPECLRVSS